MSKLYYIESRACDILPQELRVHTLHGGEVSCVGNGYFPTQVGSYQFTVIQYFH